MSNFNSDFVERTSEALNQSNSIPKHNQWDGTFLEEGQRPIDEDKPLMSAKVVLISGKYDDKYLPDDDLSVFRKFFKVPALQVLFIAGLGVVVMIMVFIALS